MKVSDLITILSAIVALGSSLTAPMLDPITGGHGAYTASVLTTVAIVAGVILRVLTNKTGAPATSVVSDATIVAAGTNVVHTHTPTIGVNTSTTSTDAPVAPQKGP